MKTDQSDRQKGFNQTEWPPGDHSWTRKRLRNDDLIQRRIGFYWLWNCFVTFYWKIAAKGLWGTYSNSGNKTVKMSSDTIRFHFYDVYIFEKLPHKFEWTICRNFFNYTSMKNNIKCLLYCFILFDIVVHVTRGQFYDTSYTSYKSKKILYEKFFALALFYLFTNRTTVSCYPVRYPKDWMELYFLLLNQNRCKIKFGSVSKLGLRYVKNWPYWEEYVEE